jgi:hypothetical protein
MKWSKETQAHIRRWKVCYKLLRRAGVSDQRATNLATGYYNSVSEVLAFVRNVTSNC